MTSGSKKITQSTRNTPVIASSVKRPAPLWRRTYNAFERTVNAPLANLVSSEVFADGLALAGRTRSGCLRLVERRTRRALHLFNLPAATDVRQLQAQMATMNRRLIILTEQQMRGPIAPPPANTTPANTTPANTTPANRPPANTPPSDTV